MPESSEQLCRDLNSMSAWLALDDFAGKSPDESCLRDLDAIVLLGNQVVATLTAACALAQRSPAAKLLFSGGVGHSTGLLYENLRDSSYGALIHDRSIRPKMAEAEMYAVVAEKSFAIPPGRLLLEKQSRNGGENARFSLKVLKDALGWPGTILLLQDPTMQRRSMLIWEQEAELALMESRVLSHAAFIPRVEPGPDGMPQLVESQSKGTWTLERFVGLVLGEFERLNDDQNGYGPRGKKFLPHVEIPSSVWESYRQVSASSLHALAAR